MQTTSFFLSMLLLSCSCDEMRLCTLTTFFVFNLLSLACFCVFVSVLLEALVLKASPSTRNCLGQHTQIIAVDHCGSRYLLLIPNLYENLEILSQILLLILMRF